MASRFWVGGTGTWDSSTTTHWAATTGGAGGQSVPGSADTVTFDGSSGGGTVTVNFGGTITVQSITCGAFTGTLDFSANNNSVTLSAATGLNNNGSGTRTLNWGSGTWTFTGASTTIISTGTTGLTQNASSASIVFTATTATARGNVLGNSTSYGQITISANSSGGGFNLTGGSTGVTFTSLSVAAPNYVLMPSGTTKTITNAMSISGSSSSQIGFAATAGGNIATVSSANNGTFTWSSFHDMTFSGGGTFTASSSFDLGHNSGITITAPASGGGGPVAPTHIIQRGTPY